MYLATPDPAPPLHALCCNLSEIWLAVIEVQLRESGDSNLACDSTESREDPSPVAWARTDKKCRFMRHFCPHLIDDGVPFLWAFTSHDNNHPPSSTICHLLVFPFPSLLKVQSVFIHHSSREWLVCQWVTARVKDSGASEQSGSLVFHASTKSGLRAWSSRSLILCHVYLWD